MAALAAVAAEQSAALPSSECPLGGLLLAVVSKEKTPQKNHVSPFLFVFLEQARRRCAGDRSLRAEGAKAAGRRGGEKVRRSINPAGNWTSAYVRLVTA